MEDRAEKYIYGPGGQKKDSPVGRIFILFPFYNFYIISLP